MSQATQRASDVQHPVQTRRRWQRRWATRRRPAFVSAARYASAAALLDDGWADGADHVQLVGERPGGDAAGFRRWAALPADHPWSEGDHYLRPDRLDRPVLRYRHPAHGEVAVHRVAAWFGEGSYSTAEATEAWHLLERAIRDAFDRQAALASTPAVTGGDLILRSMPAGREHPTLPIDQQRLIRSTSGQGRFELLLDGDGGELARLVEADMRLAYAPIAVRLPVGPARHTDEPATEAAWRPGGELRYQHGRYRVRFRVPEDWSHVGLLPVTAGDHGWRWPAEPGSEHVTWADGAELLVAAEQGWSWRVLERLELAEDRPLDAWVRRLTGNAGATQRVTSVRDLLLRAWRRPGPPARPVVALAAEGMRAIVLHTIGSLQGRGSPVTREAPSWQPHRVPEHATELRAVGDRLVWTEHRPSRVPELSHPEWSSAVWARCRARLLVHRPQGAGMLTVGRGQLVACQQDAITLTVDPGWASDRLGHYRVKRRRAGPLAAPGDLAELRELLADA